MEQSRISLIKFLPGIAWFFIVAFLTLMPGKDVPTVDFLTIPHFDKIVHFCMFTGLVILFSLPFSKAAIPFQKKNRILKRVALVMVVWGILIELIQLSVPGRGFDWFDIGADALGVLAGYLFVKWIAAKTRLQKRIPFF